MRTSKSTKAVMRYDRLKGRKKTPSAARWISPNGTREIRWRRAPLGSGIDKGLAIEAMQLYSCAEMPANVVQARKSRASSAPKTTLSVYGPCIGGSRSEEHTSELQSLTNIVCRLLLE